MKYYKSNYESIDPAAILYLFPIRMRQITILFINIKVCVIPHLQNTKRSMLTTF